MILTLVLPSIALLFSIFNSLTMRVVRNSDAKQVEESVSVLIPMRNEEQNVDGILNSVLNTALLSQIEIVVLNDHSTDSTESLLEKYPEVRSIHGVELPEDWLGKNFACHQLVAHSNGAYLVFIDADVRLTEHSLAAAITDMNSYGWDFISPYPRQLAATFFERLIQPLLQWSWLASIPLRFAERQKFSSMVVANGQFFIVKRQAYLEVGGHKTIRHEVLDDLELARLLVKHGFKGSVTDGSEVAECRMYLNHTELFAGYSKSLWRAFGSPAGAVVASTLLFISGVLPFFLGLAGSRIAWIAYFLIVLSRYIAAIRTRSTPSTALLHPLAIIVLIYLIALSWYKKVTGQLLWRGRSVA
ncbi:MAG: glycosyltransferase [Actinomycetota bacterium]